MFVGLILFFLLRSGIAAVAEILSVGRTRLQSKMIGTGTILADFAGLGGTFLNTVEAAGASNPDLKWLIAGNVLRGEFDIGDPASRAGLQALGAQPGMEPFAAGIAKLLARGVTEDPIHHSAVSAAIAGA